MRWKYFALGAGMIVATLVATLIAYPYLPNSVPTHWNVHDVVDAYSPKWVLFLFAPGIMAGMMGLFFVIPWLSPRHFQVDRFQSTYLYMMVVVLNLVVYLHSLLLWAGLSGAMHIGRASMGGICLLFALLGNVLGKVRRNFYVGVRTPWTLANEHVWNNTHRFAAKTFVLGGLLGLVLTAVWAQLWITFGILAVAAVAPIAYSLILYKRLERLGEL